MILIPLMAALLVATPARPSKPVNVTVQMPVHDSALPTGPLAWIGSAGEGASYADASSFGRSDIPDTIRIVTVIVRQKAEP